MRKRRIRLLLIGVPVAAVAIVGLVMVLTREREPEYGGKKLSEWVERIFTVLPPSGRSETEAAIRHIGTNAIPFLLKWIRQEPPPWETHPFYDQRRNLPSEAEQALKILGPEAARAVPALALMMNATNAPGTAERATYVLEGLMYDVESANIALMTNKAVNLPDRSVNLRIDSIHQIERWEGPKDPALPGLIQCLQDTNIQVSCSAGLMLTRLEARLAVPALTRCLQDKRPRVRCLALTALGQFRAEAGRLVPVFVPLLKDPDPDVREFATNTLYIIQADLLEKKY